MTNEIMSMEIGLQMFPVIVKEVKSMSRTEQKDAVNEEFPEEEISEYENLISSGRFGKQKHASRRKATRHKANVKKRELEHDVKPEHRLEAGYYCKANPWHEWTRSHSKGIYDSLATERYEAKAKEAMKDFDLEVEEFISEMKMIAKLINM